MGATDRLLDNPDATMMAEAAVFGKEAIVWPIYAQAFEITAACIALAFAAWAIVDISRGFRICRNIAILLFFAYYGLPVYLDLTLGTVQYAIFPGFNPARKDVSTTILYSLTLISTPLFIIIFNGLGRGTVQDLKNRALTSQQGPILRWGIYVAAFLPVFLAVISPARMMYLDFGTAAFLVSSTGDSTQIIFHTLVSLASMFSLLFSAYLIGTKPQRLTLWSVCYLTLPGLMAVWVNGKRFALAYFVVLVFTAFWVRRSVLGPKLLLLGMASLIVLLSFSAWYQNTIRSSNDWTASRQYESTRVDYGRDHNLRLVLSYELNASADQILDFRGQSFLNYSFMLIPRSVWSDKPPTYASFVTDAALEQKDPKRNWGITTSLLDEAVANLGYIGIVAGPALLSIITRIGDRTTSAFLVITSVMMVVMSLSVHLSAFYPIFLFWLALVVGSRVSLVMRSKPIQPRRQGVLLRA